MAIDTSGIDIKAVIDQLCCIRWCEPTWSRGEIVYKGGPCPFCLQGTDRFAVFTGGEKPHFYCGIHGNGCGMHGDVIAFVQRINGYASVGRAIGDLQKMGFALHDTHQYRTHQATRTQPEHNTRQVINKPAQANIPQTTSVQPERGQPCQQWQDRGNALINAAQRHLWSAVGQEALAYLHSRGLHDDIIRRFRLGYWPSWTECRLADWGLEGESSAGRDKTFWLRPGILFPSTEKDVLWSIVVRVTAYSKRERQEMAQGKQTPRYKQIRGGGNGLFNGDAIEAGKPLFMTEGIIDALSIVQETPYSAVAAGSTSGAQLSHWIGKLNLASPLLLAFDHDDGKGERAATYWTEIVFPEHARYWQPWEKDVNEMLQRGHDLALWAMQGIATLPVGHSSLPPDRLLRTSVSTSEPASEPASEHIPIAPDPLPLSAPVAPDIPIKSVSTDKTPVSVKHDDPDDFEGIYDIPTVQRIVWMFGKAVALESPTYTFAYYVQMPRHHQPTTLAPLPREKCPHHVTIQDEGFIKRGVCNRVPLAHGWCQEHAASAALLELGARRGYPAVKIDAYRAIDAGIEQWERYAQTTVVGVKEMRILKGVKKG